MTPIVPLDFACPKCHADVRVSCTTPKGRKCDSHPERVSLVAEAVRRFEEERTAKKIREDTFRRSLKTYDLVGKALDALQELELAAGGGLAHIQTVAAQCRTMLLDAALPKDGGTAHA